VRALLVLVLVGGCQSCREIGGGAGIDLPYLGVVYECAPAEGEVLELCFEGDEDELAESVSDAYGGMWSCSPTGRHLGPCWHHCDGGRGCNARSGCWGCQ
jgi:hypothetical protein